MKFLKKIKIDILNLLGKRVGFIKVIYLLSGGLALLVVIGLFFSYARSLKKARKQFRENHDELISSNLQNLEFKFKEEVNLLSYDLLSKFGSIPKGTNAPKYILDNLTSILSGRDYITKVYYLDFVNKKCLSYYPRRYKINSKFIDFLDYKVVVFKKDSLSKNLVYVYIPNPATERVDSVIWGLMSLPVKKAKRTVGLLFVATDINKEIRRFAEGSFIKNAIALKLIPKDGSPEEGKHQIALDWDNKKLIMAYTPIGVETERWKITYSKLAQNIKITFFVTLFIVLGAFAGIVLLFEFYDRIQEKEIREAERERSILEASGEQIEKNVESKDPDRIIFDILKDFCDETGIGAFIVKKIPYNDPEIIPINIDPSVYDQIQCANEFVEKVVCTSKEFSLDKVNYETILIQDAELSHKKYQFYQIFLDVVELGARLSFRSIQKREIEEHVFLAILKILGAKDNYTCDHSVSVAKIAAYIASEIGVEKYGLRDYDVRVIETAGSLHDIGKIGIPDEILNKHGSYTPMEYDIMKQHPLYTATILAPLAKHIEFYKDVAEIAVNHHERLDGSGYPRGIKGDEFTIPMQILAIADSLDAMMRDRPYKKAKSLEEVREDLKSIAGKKFDAELTYLVLEKLEEIQRIPASRKKEHCKIDLNKIDL